MEKEGAGGVRLGKKKKMVPLKSGACEVSKKKIKVVGRKEDRNHILITVTKMDGCFPCPKKRRRCRKKGDGKRKEATIQSDLLTMRL